MEGTVTGIGGSRYLGVGLDCERVLKRESISKDGDRGDNLSIHNQRISKELSDAARVQSRDSEDQIPSEFVVRPAIV